MSELPPSAILGVVLKVSSPQTIKITTKVTTVHPLYRKRYTLNRTYTAHDPESVYLAGDKVTIVPCRPISKRKSWVVVGAPIR